ncbi:IS3 family transposase [uncultured Cohaesibacter sp.]|uniref:IS3 family transposase n=1 Tax=uncultured Cohaesibacter sp. TaxID=1002546 RepID=UPI0029C6FB12|nr:IS3 family transposase [uncultured Cohaesibacter sp.]
MPNSHFTEEFKIEAVKQITERGYSVAEVSERLGVSSHSLYAWKKRYGKPNSEIKAPDAQAAEIRRLKQELARVTEERDILKKANGVLRKGCKMKYAFIAQHRPEFSIRAMCRCLSIHPSGFYAWLKQPLSNRALEDLRQTDLIRQVWDDSGKVYGYRKIHDDLLDMGESSCPNRVARLASLVGIRAQIGYKRKPGKYGGKPSLVVDNHLNRQFEVEAPNMVWVTDITYIKTQEGFAYLAVVIDLFSRKVVGWSLRQRQATDVVLQALLMAVWRRKPKQKVLIHSDQGSQFTSIDWAAFLRQHNLEHSMSRRGNCHDNAVAESFFNLLKRERIRRRVYKTRADARRDIFDYIEMFYNPKRKHATNGMLSPTEYERQKI